MQDNDTNIGHCMSEIAVSGRFLVMDKNGTLVDACAMFQQRATIAEDLREVEQKLLSCNNPPELFKFAAWCEARNKDFATELKAMVEKLEVQKRELTIALEEIDRQLAAQNLGFEWRIAPGFGSLVPEGCFDPVVELRSMIIRKNREKKSHQDVCRILDSTFRAEQRPERFFPENWEERHGVTTFLEAYRHPDCRNLVDKMFSSARRRGP